MTSNDVGELELLDWWTIFMIVGMVLAIPFQMVISKPVVLRNLVIPSLSRTGPPLATNMIVFDFYSKVVRLFR